MRSHFWRLIFSTWEVLTGEKLHFLWNITHITTLTENKWFRVNQSHFMTILTKFQANLYVLYPNLPVCYKKWLINRF